MTARDLDHLQDIAALADGRLAGAAREEALARLAASDADAEILADAAAVLRELEEEDAGGPVADVGAADAVTAIGAGEGERTESAVVVDVPVPGGTPVIPLRPPSAEGRRRRVTARWLALAALVAGAMLIPLALSRGGSPGDPGALVARLENRQAGLRGGWDQRAWSVTRGSTDPVAEASRAVRAGALLVDLKLAIDAGQAAETNLLAARIQEHLGDVPASGPAALIFAEIAQRAEAGPTEREALEELYDEGAATLAALLPADHLGFGAWAEAARFAALARDEAFFDSRESRAGLDRLVASPAIDPSARGVAERIRTTLAAEGAPDWAALSRDVDALLGALG